MRAPITVEEFATLALKLRDAGAVKVRAGELEVVWAAPPVGGGPMPPELAFRLAERAQNGARKPRPNDKPMSAEDARMQAFQRELAGDD